jgi:hypothetical protein
LFDINMLKVKPDWFRGWEATLRRHQFGRNWQRFWVAR